MKRSGWRELGSGSDAALLIWAPSLPELYVFGTRALVHFSLDIHDTGREMLRGPEVKLNGPDSIELFLLFLNEVNYRLQVNNWISLSPCITRLGEEYIVCRLDGFARDNQTDHFLHEVKAVTRHRPFLNRGSDGTWVARVTLDL